MALQHVFYLSRATSTVRERDIQQILMTARRNNWRRDVTGCLLYTGTHFAQTLEGEEAVVRELVARIAQDARHTDFRVLYDLPVPRRRFGEWAMGYLYDQGAAAELVRVSEQSAPAPAEVQALMARMDLDPVMGGIQGGLTGGTLRAR